MKEKSGTLINFFWQVNCGATCDESLKFLGDVLDSKQTWEKHSFAMVFPKLSILIWQFSKNVIMTAYHGNYVSLIIYGILNWGYSIHVQSLKRCTSVIANLGWRECCKQYVRNFDIWIFSLMYVLNCLKCIFPQILISTIIIQENVEISQIFRVLQ